MVRDTAKETSSGIDRSKSGVRNARVTVVALLSCALLLVAACWVGGYRCWADTQEQMAVVQAVSPALAQVPAGSEPVSVKPDLVAEASELICRGAFREAGERLRVAETLGDGRVGDLKGIVQRYEQIGRERKLAKEAAYQKQRVELAQLQSTVDLERRDVPTIDANAVDGADDPNEPNDVTDVLAVVVKAAEFADSDQKAELLADPYVQKVMQEAVDRSILLEAEGKWLNAYTRYYYWLQAIDPNNKGYSTHAEELLERAGIAASFQDSPCETRKERYDGVVKLMFERAIEALDLHYVNSISYPEMATKAIKRCDLLAEVLTITFANDAEATKDMTFEPPAPEKVTAWSVALAGLRDEIEASIESFGKDEFLDVLDKVLAINETTVELPRRPLIAHFSEAALETLDPYTVMVWPRQVQDFEKVMMNEFTGIGIEISKPRGLLTVASLLPDTPAYRAGLDAGDVIEKVDGVPTIDMSLLCAVKKITGPKGTKVNLTIRRRGREDTYDVTITRDRIIVPTIRGWQRTEGGDWLYMLDEEDRIGYIRITSFSGDTASDLERVLDRLEADGMNGLILDLRFNTGGLLDSAVKVVDKFLAEGLIVRTQPKANMIPAYEHAHRRGTHPDYPLVILINSHSASASEIVAGALADERYERAVLVGTRTHGKGSVQGITHYPGGRAELKYTMAYYHLPSGQRVKSRDAVEKEGRKDWGVGPDVEVKLTSEELKKMLDVQRDNDVLVQANRTDNGTSLNKHSIDETLEADPQLAVGLLVVKAQTLKTGVVAAN